MKSLAIITARGGSKRIPRKNLRAFLGKPILLYSIEAARSSGLFEEVMVSTDDEEIARLAQSAGASVPFLRSAETSDDYAPTALVLKEVLTAYRERGRSFELACCLYPTAPFVTAQKLGSALDLLVKSGADCVFPVTRFSFPIGRALQLDPTGRVSFLWPENALRRSQDLQPAFHDAGQFYFFRVAHFLKALSLIGENTLGLEVSELEVQDIDQETDWRLAELKYQCMYGSQSHGDASSLQG